MTPFAPYTISDLERIEQTTNALLSEAARELGYEARSISTAIVHIVLEQAAAPKLLAACEEAEQFVDNWCQWMGHADWSEYMKGRQLRATLQAAIAQARGEGECSE